MPQQALPSTTTQALPCSIEMGTLPRYLAAWLLDGRIRGLSPGTLANRNLIVTKLLWWLEQNRTPTLDLRGFLDYVATGHTEEAGRWGNKRNGNAPCPSTSLMYFARLRTFFAFLV